MIGFVRCLIGMTVAHHGESAGLGGTCSESIGSSAKEILLGNKRAVPQSSGLVALVRNAAIRRTALRWVTTVRGADRDNRAVPLAYANLCLPYASIANAAAAGSPGFVRIFNLWSTSLSSRSRNS